MNEHGWDLDGIKAELGRALLSLQKEQFALMKREKVGKGLAFQIEQVQDALAALNRKPIHDPIFDGMTPD